MIHNFLYPVLENASEMDTLEAPRLCSKIKDKMADGSGFPSPPPHPLRYADANHLAPVV